jgi:hypothetical protein
MFPGTATESPEVLSRRCSTRNASEPVATPDARAPIAHALGPVAHVLELVVKLLLLLDLYLVLMQIVLVLEVIVVVQPLLVAVVILAVMSVPQENGTVLTAVPALSSPTYATGLMPMEMPDGDLIALMVLMKSLKLVVLWTSMVLSFVDPQLHLSHQ